MNKALSGIFLVGFFVAFATGATMDQGQRPMSTYEIDLLGREAQKAQAPEAAPDRLELPFGRLRGAMAHKPEPPQPVSLELVGFDRSLYSIGDRFVYEIVAKNVSQKPIAFPTSNDQSRFPRNTARPVGASVSVVMNDAMFGRQVIGTQALYGAPNMPDTILILRPGETVGIRSTGEWFLGGAFLQAPPANWSRQVGLRASVQLFSTVEAYPLFQSENTVEIHLQSH